MLSTKAETLAVDGADLAGKGRHHIVGLRISGRGQKGVVNHQNGIVAHQRARAGRPADRAHRGGHPLVDTLRGDFRVLDGGVGAHAVHDRTALAVDKHADQRRAAAFDVVEFVVETAGRLFGNLTVKADSGYFSLAELAYDIFQLGCVHSSVFAEG